MSRLTVRPVCIVAEGPDAALDAHAAVRAGEVTVLAALGSQARVLSRVRVLRGDDAAAAAAPATGAGVHFDRLPPTPAPGDGVSFTAGALGAGTLPLGGVPSDGKAVVVVRV
jgi:hypothetical protein